MVEGRGLGVGDPLGTGIHDALALFHASSSCRVCLGVPCLQPRWACQAGSGNRRSKGSITCSSIGFEALKRIDRGGASKEISREWLLKRTTVILYRTLASQEPEDSSSSLNMCMSLPRPTEVSYLLSVTDSR